MQVYRAYVNQYSPSDHLWHTIAWLRVLAFDINEDAMARATSTFEVFEVPEDISIGDMLQLKYSDGSPMYVGIIEKIEDTVITTSQLQSLFKGQWVYQTRPDKSDTTSSGHSTRTHGLYHEVAQVIYDYLNGNTYNNGAQDLGMYNKFKGINLVMSTDNEFIIEYLYEYDWADSMPQEDKTMDFEDFLYLLFEQYNFTLGGWSYHSTTGIENVMGLTLYPMDKVTSVLTFSDNTRYFRNFEVVSTRQETNKLTIYNKDGEFRANYYLTPNGATTDSTDIARIYPTVNKIIYSDDAFDDILRANMPDNIFDHQIQFDMDILNPYYDNILQHRFGKRMIVNARGYTFDTIYTGHRFVKEKNKDLSSITIVCGKARTSLTKKLLAQGVI